MEDIDNADVCCAICQNQDDSPNPHLELVTLPCVGRHAFHPECIQEWLIHSPKRNCPTCRGPLHHRNCGCALSSRLLIPGACLHPSVLQDPFGCQPYSLWRGTLLQWLINLNRRIKTEYERLYTIMSREELRLYNHSRDAGELIPPGCQTLGGWIEHIRDMRGVHTWANQIYKTLKDAPNAPVGAKRKETWYQKFLRLKKVIREFARKLEITKMTLDAHFDLYKMTVRNEYTLFVNKQTMRENLGQKRKMSEAKIEEYIQQTSRSDVKRRRKTS